VLDILRTRQLGDFRNFRVRGFGSVDAKVLIDRVGKEINEALVRPRIVPAVAVVEAVIAAPPPPEPLVVGPVEVQPPPPDVTAAVQPPPAAPAVELRREAPRPNRWKALGLVGIGVVMGLASWAAWTAAHPVDPNGEAGRAKDAVEQAVKAAEQKFAAERRTLTDEVNDARTKAAADAKTLADTQADLTQWRKDFKDLGVRQQAEVAQAVQAAKEAFGAERSGLEAQRRKAVEDAKIAETNAREASRLKWLAEVNLTNATADFRDQSAELVKQRDAALAKAVAADRDLQAAKTALATAEAQRNALEAQLKPFLEAAARPPAPPPQASGLVAGPNRTTYQEANCPECPKLVIVPTGRFIRGSDATGTYAEPGRYSNEGPAREVAIPAAFALGRTPVTEKEFAAFANDKTRTYTLSDNSWRRNLPGHPVVNVSWDDAKAYIVWLNTKKAGGEYYRLPSEAEWEYGARAGTQTARFWGDGFVDAPRYAHVRGRGTAPVGERVANGFGLHDMLGNVWEWMADSWHGSYLGAPDDGSAWTKGNSGRCVLRGGSWYDGPRDVRAGVRINIVRGIRFGFVGFRLSRTSF
jgi:formylglycine-generating enzyme required for sulfatase activity